MDPAAKPPARARRAYLVLAAVAAVVAAAWLGHRWLTGGKQHTDDAQVDADVVPVTARVAGDVKVARVHDHQRVKAGEVLFELDPSDLDLEVARAEAEVAAARAEAAAADAQVAVVVRFWAVSRRDRAKTQMRAERPTVWRNAGLTASSAGRLWPTKSAATAAPPINIKNAALIRSRRLGRMAHLPTIVTP